MMVSVGPPSVSESGSGSPRDGSSAAPSVPPNPRPTPAAPGMWDPNCSRPLWSDGASGRRQEEAGTGVSDEAAADEDDDEARLGCRAAGRLPWPAKRGTAPAVPPAAPPPRLRAARCSVRKRIRTCSEVTPPTRAASAAFSAAKGNAKRHF